MQSNVPTPSAHQAPVAWGSMTLTNGILGAKVPDVHSSAWRTFWTQQHGDNVTFEVGWSR